MAKLVTPPPPPAEAKAEAGPSGEAEPSDPNAAARWDAEQAAAAEGVDVEGLSQQMGDLSSPSKPPAPKKPKTGGDGGPSSQALELTETQE